MIYFLLFLLFLTPCLAFKECHDYRGKFIKLGHVKGTYFNYYKDDDGRKVYYGEFPKLFHYLQRALGWEFKFIESPDRQFGDQFPNGTNTGLVGMLARKEVDMAMGLAVTLHRAKSIDFSLPYTFDEMGLLSHKPGYISKNLALTWPFDTETWIATFLSYFLFSISILFIVKLSNYLTFGQEPQEYYYNILNCWHETCKPYFGTAIIYFPVKRVPKLVILLFIVMIFVLSKGYSSCLISSLTKPATEKEIDTFQQLIDSKSHKFIVPTGVHFMHLLKIAKDGHFKNLYDKFVNEKGKRINIFATKKALLEDKRAVILVMKHVNRVSSALNWGTPLGKTFAHWSKQTAYSSTYAIGLTKNSTLRHCIDPWISQMWEAGLFQIWRTIGTNEARQHNPIFKNVKSQKHMRRVLNSLPTLYDENEPLSLAQLQGAFYLYFLFITFAILASIQEIAGGKMRKCLLCK